MKKGHQHYTALSSQNAASASVTGISALQEPPVRLWDYLVAQVTCPVQDEVAYSKHERIYNFLHVPQKLEQLLFLGYFVCLDSFLYIFTILPLRILLSLLSLLQRRLSLLLRRREPKRTIPYFRSDLLRGLLLLSVGMLLQQIDASRLYHSIRGQSVIKLYVIFNVFEVLDKLCCSFGLDILDSFFSKQHLEEDNGNGGVRLNPALHFILAIIYVFIHTMVLFFQAITLNVAINSFSNALLTLLVSNQFVEIKSAVFKKFEKENLFQLSCAGNPIFPCLTLSMVKDILERFQLSIYLLIIGFRNLTAVSATLDLDYVLNGLLVPLGLVLLSEILVDWLKHSFITKFNHIHPDVYLRFMDTLSRDFESDATDYGTLADQSPAVSKRIGFSSFPLACLLVRIILQTMTVSEGWSLAAHWPLLLGIFAVLFLTKISLGISLIIYTRYRNRLCLARLKPDPEASKSIDVFKSGSVVRLPNNNTNNKKTK